MATLVRGLLQAGTYTVHWDGRNDNGRTLASGVYLYRLQAGPFSQVRKVTLINRVGDRIAARMPKPRWVIIGQRGSCVGKGTHSAPQLPLPTAAVFWRFHRHSFGSGASRDYYKVLQERK